ncbi:FAD-dependent monooxygenase [Croceicoccus sp. F390]|uniref:FAD-dependent monooxygenase n=1 Tax=Croceicoccus esteveae TaxID=3075597 RepID=A0ABU2ZI69_9SPHN|nr:FAD-dependent monooxygenase [Croceicoccus sp. F390]MDT0575901.1 FAD-dependent monooxygenase [Croceicoccus sp. F390]
MDPLILGAGPGGCAAAIVLAQGGAAPVLIDRAAQVDDPLCGGFLSWQTLRSLSELGVPVLQLGGHRVHRLRLFSRTRQVSVPLPHPATGLSRHALDQALRHRALELGARLEVDVIRSVEGDRLIGRSRDWRSSAIFLASGKHDVRGERRPRRDADPALGLRLRLPFDQQVSQRVSGSIELHLFHGGYAGIVMQEGGSLNICLALKKSLLASAGSEPQVLVERLAQAYPAFADRLAAGWEDHRVETIGSVPYGWIAQSTRTGLFRLGDQAAVIPSLAGEGNSIALASGMMAARYWLAGGAEAAPAYQRAFARRAKRPVMLARAARAIAERDALADWGVTLARLLPFVVNTTMELTRIDVRKQSGPGALQRLSL